MKKLNMCFAAFALASCLFACGGSGNNTPAASSVDNTPKIVAEGTGFVSHGYDMNLLYQEWSDGSCNVWQTNYMDGYVPMGVKYEGTITKGKDEDGDPFVNLKVSAAYMYSADEQGVLTKTESTESWTTGEDCYTNTVTSDYEYSMPFTFSLFGYTNKTATIEVKATSNPTDHNTWCASQSGFTATVFTD